MSENEPYWERLPTWALAVGPVVILAVVAAVLYLTWPFSNLEGMSEASTLEIVWMLTIVGAIAGIVPVAIGMLWFPYIRHLDVRLVHGFIALGAGVLTFIAVEMIEDMVEYAGEIDRSTMGLGIGVLAIAITFGVMYFLSQWRATTASSTSKSGLQIAYLVAIALGLHSIGEGLAIGVYFVLDEGTMVMLLVIGFVIHNVLEGLTCVAAMARDDVPPKLRHFGAIALLAGGPVIFGGWIGSLGEEPLLALLFFAIAIGAILQAIIEMIDLVRIDAESIVTRTTVATFVAGFFLMFLLEDVIVEGWIVPG